MGLCNQGAALFHALGGQKLGAAENDSRSAFDLVDEELAEILEVHAALAGVHHGGAAADFNVGMALARLFHRRQDLGQFAHAGGLDQDALWMIGVDQLVDGGLEVARQGAADAAGVELGHCDADVLQESAVHADFAVFIFQQHDLLIAETAGEQLLDQRCFAGAQEAGNDIDFNHKE